MAPNPPVGFAVTTFGLQEDVLGTREYTHARDAGVSNPRPAKGGPANGATASSGTKTCKWVCARTPLSPRWAILDAGDITLPRGDLLCAPSGTFGSATPWF